MSLVGSCKAAPERRRLAAVSAHPGDQPIQSTLTTPSIRPEFSKGRAVGEADGQVEDGQVEPEDALPVLLAASNAHSRKHFRELIAKGGYRVAAAASGKEAIRLLQQEVFTLAVIHELDDFPPSKLSREFKLRVRQELRPELPVVLLASTFDPDYAVRCLRAGADDYITGPHLEARVLLARLDAVLRSYRRRSNESRREPKESMRVGDIMLDPVRFRVEVTGKPLDLTRIQFHILYAMACRPGRVFSRSQLRGVIAEHGGNPDDNSIKSHICHLRRRLGAAGSQIETARGVGYRIIE